MNTSNTNTNPLNDIILVTETYKDLAFKSSIFIDHTTKAKRIINAFSELLTELPQVAEELKKEYVINKYVTLFGDDGLSPLSKDNIESMIENFDHRTNSLLFKLDNQYNFVTKTGKPILTNYIALTFDDNSELLKPNLVDFNDQGELTIVEYNNNLCDHHRRVLNHAMRDYSKYPSRVHKIPMP